MVTTMAAVSVAQQQHQQFIDRISGLEARMAVLQTHAEAQQERIRVAEIVIQQLQANPTNPPPPLRDAFQKQVTEGGALKALTKNTENHSEYHDWSFSARRALTRADDRFAGLLQWISGEIDEVNEIDVLEYRETWTGTTRSSTRCWPSRHLTRRGHPSSHQKQWKSRELLAGSAWNAKRVEDSKGDHHVSGSGWRRWSAIMESGSAECVAPESVAKSVPLVETEASRQGQMFHTADGGVIKNKWEKTVKMYSETVDQYRARYQITDATRPLNSASRACDQGNNVLFTQTGGWIINHETGRYSLFSSGTRSVCAALVDE